MYPSYFVEHSDSKQTSYLDKLNFQMKDKTYNCLQGTHNSCH